MKHTCRKSRPAILWSLIAALLAVPVGCRRQDDTASVPAVSGEARTAQGPVHGGKAGRKETFPEQAWYEAWRSGETGGAPVPEPWPEIFRTLADSQAAFEFDPQGRLIGVDMASRRRVGGDAEIRAAVQIPHLRRLAVSGFGVTPEGVRLLTACTSLEELALENTKIDDASLAELAALPNLRSLNLRRSVHLTDAALETLTQFPKLEQLYLHDNAFSADALTKLTALRSLRLLDLRGCPGVGEEVLGKICGLPRLSDLRVRGYAIDDACMAAVASCRQLSAFTLEEAAVTGKGFARLADLPLTSLTLYKCLSIREDDLAVLARFPRLTRLTLRDMPLRGDFLRHMAAASRLTELRLYQTMVGDGAGEYLRNFKALRRLDLSKTLIGDSGLAAVAELPALRELLVAETMVTDQGVSALAQLPELEVLDLTGNVGVSDQSVAALQAMPKLKTVFLDGTSVSRDALGLLGDRAKASLPPSE
ncbi:MAG: hypothetical protein GYA33_03460 [Thermogutta sp.]|nr:hypothetical protein [Thermogutta sp.]